MEFNATFFVSVISFLVFVFIMNKIFYAPLTKVTGERQKLLDANYNEAEKFNGEAETILKGRDERLSDTESKSRKIISDKIENENVSGKALTDEASKKSSEEIHARKEELAQEKASAQVELESKVLGLAESIASKVMGMDVKIQKEAAVNGVK